MKCGNLTPPSSDYEIVLEFDPPSDIAQELVRLTGKRAPVALDDTQVNQLRAYGRAVASHRHKDQEILVLCDDITQHLVVIKNTSAPHFAFFPN